MTNPQPDQRSAARRQRDERIAAEPPRKPPTLPPDAVAQPVENHLARLKGNRHPVAMAGIVENGLVRPLDPAVKLPEHARVIIVASEEAA